MTIQELTADLERAIAGLQAAKAVADSVVKSSDDTKAARVRKACAAVKDFSDWAQSQVEK